ncbi:hypothetical protein DLM75_16155 [Leptospira stimsonii]|uniref:Uncharacterized protein n=1 Tax=Leptospira stimsonii TaxID=2202203 RepID=A0A396Z3M4_9LEPT|nr:hypothetical protein DLM75_16155 [Leptospira stimsonii]
MRNGSYFFARFKWAIEFFFHPVVGILFRIRGRLELTDCFVHGFVFQFSESRWDCNQFPPPFEKR